MTQNVEVQMPMLCEIQYVEREDGYRVWVNLDSKCVLRLQCVGVLVISNSTPNEEPK